MSTMTAVILTTNGQPYGVVLVPEHEWNKIGYAEAQHNIHTLAALGLNEEDKLRLLRDKGYTCVSFAVLDPTTANEWQMVTADTKTREILPVRFVPAPQTIATKVSQRVEDTTRWLSKPWTMRNLSDPNSHVLTVDPTLVAQMLTPVLGDETDALYWMKDTYRKQSPTWVYADQEKTKRVALAPPDKYDDTQCFLCQQCGQRYTYGDAKKALWGMYRTEEPFTPYDPLCFCSVEHCEAYYEKHQHGPRVAAEIPLGEFERSMDMSRTAFGLHLQPYGVIPSHVTNDRVVFEVPLSLVESILHHEDAPAPKPVASVE